MRSLQRSNYEHVRIFDRMLLVSGYVNPVALLLAVQTNTSCSTLDYRLVPTEKIQRLIENWP